MKELNNQVDAKEEIAVDAVEGYLSWAQAGGYFDGETIVGLEVVKRVLGFKLRFSDTWRPRIETVQTFFRAQDITTTRISHEVHPGKRDAYRFDARGDRQRP